MPLITFYKIESKDKNILDCYVGSTSNFPKRILDHKSSCNLVTCNIYNYPVYKFIRENNGFKNFEFIILEEINCKTNEERYLKERKFIELYNANLNQINPIRTLEDKNKCIKKWRQENINYWKEYYKNYSIIYREDHKEELKIKKKEYYHKLEKINCECGSIFKLNNKKEHLKTKKHLAYLEGNK